MKLISSLLLLFLLQSSTSSVQFLNEEEATILIDQALDLLKGSVTPHISIPEFTLKLGSDSYLFGNLLGSTGWLGDIQSLRRASPMVTSYSGNNVTLKTSFTFEELWLSWYRTKFTVFGSAMLADIRITFNQNEFDLQLNVFKDPRYGKCTVMLQKAGFSELSDIDITIRPVGFFKKLTIDASLTHLYQAAFQQMNYFNMTYLASFLQNNICSNIPN